MFAVISITSFCAAILGVSGVKADDLGRKIELIYSATGTSGTETISISTPYNPEQYSVETIDYDDLMNLDVAAGKTLFKPEYVDGTINEVSVRFDTAFAGWKIAKVNNAAVSDEYYIPGHDYLYMVDEPFVSYDLVTSVTLEPVWGKTIYLRDTYNFKDVTNVYGSAISVATIDWDSKEYAFSISSLNSSTADYTKTPVEIVDGVLKHTYNKPINSIIEAFDVLGSVGGKIQVINHYTLDHDDDRSISYIKSSKWIFRYGQNITTGVVTLSGKNEGYDGYNKYGEKFKDGETKNIYNNVSNDAYKNANIFVKNTPGNGKNHSAVSYHIAWLCAMNIEGINFVGHRETYYGSGSNQRYTADLFFYSPLNKRFALQNGVRFYKRTSVRNPIEELVSIRNWSHNAVENCVALSTTGSFITFYCGITTDKNMGNNIKPNLYLTTFGEGVSSNYMTHLYIQPKILDEAKKTLNILTHKIGNYVQFNFNNVHIFIEGYNVSNFNGIYGTSSDDNSYNYNINYYTVNMKNSYCGSQFSTVLNVFVTNIKHLDVSFSSDKQTSISSKATSEVFIGGRSTNVNLSMQFNVTGDSNEQNDANVYISGQYTNITNLYSGSNQIGLPVNIKDNLNINVAGGTIKYLYGGGLGGALNANEINIDITGGTITSIYGGGSGGLVNTRSSGSPMDLWNDYHTATHQGFDETLTYFYSENLKKGSVVGEKYLIFESNGYTAVNFVHMYPNSKPEDKKELDYFSGLDEEALKTYVNSHYQYTEGAMISDAVVTTNKINILIDMASGSIKGNVYGGGRNGAVNILPGEGNGIYIEHKKGTIAGNIYGGGQGEQTEFGLKTGNVVGQTSRMTVNIIFTGDETKASLEDYMNFVAADDGYSTIYEKSSQFAADNSITAAAYKEKYLSSDDLKHYNNGATNVYLYSPDISLLGRITGNTHIVLSGGTVKGNIFGGSQGHKAGITGSTVIDVISGSANKVYGGGDLGVVSESTTVNVQGGTFDYIFGGANQANIDGDINVNVSGGAIKNLFGGNDTTGDIGGDINIVVTSQPRIVTMYGGGLSADAKDVNVTIYGGNITTLYGAGLGEESQINSVNITVNNGKVSTLYGGGDAGKVIGTATTTIKSKSKDYYIATLYGGGRGSTASVGSAKVIVNSLEKSDFYIRTLYGGGDAGPVENDVNIDINNCIINNLYGGGNQADVGGNIDVNIISTRIYFNVYVANNISGNVSGSVITNIEDSIIGRVYGGGNLAAYNPTTGYSTLNITSSTIDYVFGGGLGETATSKDTHVNIRQSTIKNDVYGGGEEGSINNSYVEIDASTIKGSVYGGGLGITATSINTNIRYINNSNISNSIYGGGNAGEVTGTASTTIDSLTLSSGNVYGGGYAASVKDVLLTINDLNSNGDINGGGYAGEVTGTATTIINNGVITGNVYGAGEGETATTVNASLTINNGTIKGNVYGGGDAGKVTGKATTVILGGNFGTNGNVNTGNIYGAGRGETATTGDSELTIGGTTVASKVFAGGDAGDVTTSKVTVNSGTLTNVYGGGNVAKVTDNATVIVNGGNISNAVFGGGYGSSASTGEVSLTISNNSTVIPSVFGGGDLGKAGNINLDINEANIGSLYGGGNKADVLGDISVDITSSIVGTVFGGNNVSGSITGTINVEVDGDASITTIYGGGYAANYEGSKINLLINSNDTEVGTIYGGGMLADVSDTVVTIEDGTIENIYGGGFEGNVNNTVITIKDGTIRQNVYGGGFQGDVLDSAKTTINDGDILGNIYGGGEGREASTLTSNVVIKGGTIGTSSNSLGNVYGGGEEGPTNQTNVLVENTGSISGSTIYGSVFGGGYGLSATVIDSFVTINNYLTFEVSEALESADGSGSSDFELVSSNYKSVIYGSVYGGGDMATIGNGNIDKSSNSATITQVGSTEVHIVSGYIKGSVFGGGSGIPSGGQAYNINMGAVFGSTSVRVYSGMIEGSIFGGGNQSRTYATKSSDSLGQASNVVIAPVSLTNDKYDVPTYNKNIYVGHKDVGTGKTTGGSIFGGGNTSSGSTNASVPTTVGNTSVHIQGQKEGSTIYILGGVYGDGNLCLVNGRRSVTLKDFTTGDSMMLKTFYSVQRADVVNLYNSHIILKGAIDLVEEGDDTVYSINRVKRLNMYEGSTFKLTTIVKYLGELYSDYNKGDLTPDRLYNKYSGTGAIVNALTKDEQDAYIKDYEDYMNSIKDSDPNNDLTNIQNTVCVANGLYLELEYEDGKRGIVVGLFTLQLLIATPGEGGGFVYAKQESLTGEFISITKFDDVGEAKYMDVVDSLCRYNGYHVRFWYIAGSTINYGVNLSAYIGLSDTVYTKSISLPANAFGLSSRYYALKEIRSKGNTELERALKSGEYTLKTNSTGLIGNDIAVELVAYKSNGETVSLGYLSYDLYGSEWKWSVIRSDSTVIEGFKEELDTDVIKNHLLSNENLKDAINLDFVLHKSEFVDTEVVSFNCLDIELEIFTGSDVDNLEFISIDTSNLIVDFSLIITRLIPVQSSFISTGKQYAGVAYQEEVRITGESSLSLNTVTRYFPSSYPHVSSIEAGKCSTLRWGLTTLGMTSFFNTKTGDYVIIDSNNKVIDYSKDVLKTSIPSSITSTTSSFKVLDVTNTEVELKKLYSHTGSYFPIGTKITMVDLTNASAPTYYYYKVETNTNYIDVFDFNLMGTNDSKLRDNLDSAAFYTQYRDSSANVRVTENLVFIFDFDEATINQETYIGNILFTHDYCTQGTLDVNTGTVTYTKYSDIMNYVTTNPGTDHLERPFLMGNSHYYEYMVSTTGSSTIHGNASIDGDVFEDFTQIDFEVTITEDAQWKDTTLSDNQFTLKITYVDELGNPILMPVGMTFYYNENSYIAERVGQYVVIPVISDGTHLISVTSDLTGFLSKNNFKIEIYSSPSADYYNNFKASSDEMLISFNIVQEAGASLDVIVEDVIVSGSNNEQVSIDIFSDANDKVTFTIYKKDDQGNFVECNDIFGRYQDVNLEEDNVRPGLYHDNFKLSTNNVPAGTYMIVFNNGTAHAKRVYFIVTKDGFLE